MGVPHAVLTVRWLAALLLFGQLLAPAAVARAQDTGDCEALTQQIDSTNDELDQLKDDAAPWLVQAGQFGAIAPADMLVAAQQGLPGLDTGTAASFGAIAAQLGAAIDGWRLANGAADSPSYWRDLANALSTWHTLFAPLTPFQAGAPSLTGLSTALGELDQLAASALGDLGLSESLNDALRQCQSAAGSSTSPSTPEMDGNPQALCSVGGTAGYSNSECFRLELDAAYATWEACTEAYFAAERAAFAGGGDPPANTCDGPFQQATDELQRTWGGPP